MKKFIVLIAGIMLLVGCGGHKAVKSEVLLNNYFILIEVEVNDLKIQSDNIVSPYIEFDGSFKINGNMCNNFSGQATYDNKWLSSKNIVSTKILCTNEQLNKLDKIIAQIFSKGTKVLVEDNKLILRSDKYKLVYDLKNRVD